MANLTIIGDSFSKWKGINEKSEDKKTYLELLFDDFNVMNFSNNVVGPQYIIEKLNNNYVNDENLDYLFIVFPDSDRIHFDYLEHDDAQLPLRTWKTSVGKSMDNLSEIEKKYVEDVSSFRSTSLNKILPTLYINYILTFCNLYKKILIWPTQPLNVNLKIPVPENCFIVDKCLNHTSTEEMVYDEVISFKDSRNNHLSESNHILLYNFIKSFFMNDNRKIPFFKKEINND